MEGKHRKEPYKCSQCNYSRIKPGPLKQNKINYSRTDWHHFTDNLTMLNKHCLYVQYLLHTTILLIDIFKGTTDEPRQDLLLSNQF